MSPLLKSEFHTHTADDPKDYIPHTTEELIVRAAELGYHALAITLHDSWFDAAAVSAVARRTGVTIVSGIERSIDGRHVLLLNFGREAERVQSFEDVAALKRANPSGVVVAPHPFYPVGHSLRGPLDRHAEVFDVVELNAFYVASLTRYNDAAVEWAKRHGKPVVANADVHRLRQLDRTYSLVEAAPAADAICAALRAGDVEIRTAPLSVFEAAYHAMDLAAAQLFRKSKRSNILSPA